MNKEDIIKLAQECRLIGMRQHLDSIYKESLERFADLVAAAEREKCSKTKAATPRKLKRVGTGALLHMQQEHFEMGWREGAKSVRDAIRARGETK